MYLAVLVGGCGAQASPAVERGLLSPCGVRPVGHPAAVVTVQGPQLWRTGLLALRHVASSQTRNQPCVHLQANSFNRHGLAASDMTERLNNIKQGATAGGWDLEE